MSKIITEKINSLIAEATKLALKEVERLARKIMKRNPKGIPRFCMAMGYATFYDAGGQPIEEDDTRLKEFYDFLDEHNHNLKLTGEPMKIDKWDAPVRTDW